MAFTAVQNVRSPVLDPAFRLILQHSTVLLMQNPYLPAAARPSILLTSMQDSPPADSVLDGSALELSANTLRRSGRIQLCESDCSHARAAAKRASLSIVVDSAQDCSGKRRVVATMLSPPLFANHVADGEECYIPEDYFIIDNIIHGPYTDSLGCTVYLCHVSCNDDSGNKFSHILWECQELDLPSRMVSTYFSEVDNAEGNH
eukprot:432201-Rhodomonas_salina.2